MTDQRLLIPVAEAAPMLGIDRSTAYRLIREGKFPVDTVRVGAHLKVPVKQIHDLADGRRPERVAS